MPHTAYMKHSVLVGEHHYHDFTQADSHTAG